MHTIEQQIEAFRIRMLRVPHGVTSKLADIFDEEIRAGRSAYDPDTETLTITDSSGQSARVKVTDDGFRKVE